MSAAEITELRTRIEALTRDERESLRAYLHFLTLRDDPAWRAKISANLHGPFHSEADLLSSHQRLGEDER